MPCHVLPYHAPCLRCFAPRSGLRLVGRGRASVDLVYLPCSPFIVVLPTAPVLYCLRFPYYWALHWKAEVKFAVRQELALRAVDVLARRTRLAFLDCAAAEAALPRVIQIMSEELGWSAERRKQEHAVAVEFLGTMRIQ